MENMNNNMNDNLNNINDNNDQDNKKDKKKMSFKRERELLSALFWQEALHLKASAL